MYVCIAYNLKILRYRRIHDRLRKITLTLETNQDIELYVQSGDAYDSVTRERCGLTKTYLQRCNTNTQNSLCYLLLVLILQQKYKLE